MQSTGKILFSRCWSQARNCAKIKAWERNIVEECDATKVE